EDRGNIGYDGMAEVLRRFQAEAAKSPVLTPLFSTYQNNFPQINVDIDRNRAKQLGVNISDITETLQSYLGSYYINDFNIIGRVYQVRMQA
ncbi:efflux RND transporter permease subunit, partial [Klebsiella pneumoniae]|nr:efflux RND transporter permease subunit [Klebsiella pneumoniae]